MKFIISTLIAVFGVYLILFYMPNTSAGNETTEEYLHRTVDKPSLFEFNKYNQADWNELLICAGIFGLIIIWRLVHKKSFEAVERKVNNTINAIAGAIFVGAVANKAKKHKKKGKEGQ
ncbi:MAG: hypothetical protein HUJ25_08700 [Crocinitomicaceae bacterium]|nr:hypothetical protein [Crocinitomicaceae bacterium]